MEATTCVVPLDLGIAIATRAVRQGHYTLVRVRTDAGVDGIGFCYGGHKGGRIVTMAVRDLLRDVVVGRDPQQTEAIWDDMYADRCSTAAAGRCCGLSAPWTSPCGTSSPATPAFLYIGT